MHRNDAKFLNYEVVNINSTGVSFRRTASESYALKTSGKLVVNENGIRWGEVTIFGKIDTAPPPPFTSIPGY